MKLADIEQLESWAKAKAAEYPVTVEFIKDACAAARQALGGDTMICPFCKEGDFDLIGLKGHLVNNWCEAYNETMTPIEERQQRLEKLGGPQGEGEFKP